MVIEAGTYEMGGQKWEAGKNTVSSAWSTPGFAQSFAAAPVVLSQIASENETSVAHTRIRNLTSANFEIRIDEQESADRVHAAEDVHHEIQSLFLAY